MPDPTKLVFFGIAGTDEICIKYVKDHYPVDAHQACTSLGCAPVLLACEKLAGNWLMVVMSALSNYSMLYHCRGRYRLPRSLFVDMSKQLKNFHSAGFVHGDIRDTNIMVSPDRKKFMIIDFDWAGKLGLVRYPLNVNKTIWRPDGMNSGEPIKAEHDMAMLKYSIAMMY